MEGDLALLMGHSFVRSYGSDNQFRWMIKNLQENDMFFSCVK